MRFSLQLYFTTILTILLTILFTTIGLSQTGKIAGRVMDRSGKEPLLFVNVIVQGTSLGAIVNIYQPYVRPIPRGKEKASVEFGANLVVSEVEGYIRINNLSWEAYNESGDLKKQVNAYKEQYGYYPEVVLAEKYI